MANTKSNKNTGRKSWKKYVLIGMAVVLLFAAYVIYRGYDLYQDRVDASRFYTLQWDFKKLQTEFNKVDPGWEYSERCSAAHYALGDGQPSCEVAIYAKSKGATAQENRASYLSSAGMIIGEVANTESDSMKSLQRKGFDQPGSSYCAIRFGSNESKASVTCSGAARSFYFERSDR